MHKLAFGTFHERHFGPQQQQEWKTFLNMQSLDENTIAENNTTLPEWQKVHDTTTTATTATATATPYDQGQAQGHEKQQQQQQQDQIQIQAQTESYTMMPSSLLSHEAISYFQQSEAYQKELAENVDEQWEEVFEPSATSLVLHDNLSVSDELRLLEHLVNASYLETCQQGAALWPSLPLRSSL